MNCKLNGEIVNGIMKMNQRSFNLIDFYLILYNFFLIYSDDCCHCESLVMTYFKIEQDMLWIWFINYFSSESLVKLHYIQANSEGFNVNKLLAKKDFMKKFCFHFYQIKSTGTKGANFHEEIKLKIVDENGKNQGDNKLINNVNLYENNKNINLLL